MSPYVCDQEEDDAFVLAEHALVSEASHGKSLWASIPPRVSVYLHNPQATLSRPAQTALLGPGDESIPDRGDCSGAKETCSVHSDIRLEGNHLWSYHYGMIPPGGGDAELNESGKCFVTRDCGWDVWCTCVHLCICLCESLSVSK